MMVWSLGIPNMKLAIAYCGAHTKGGGANWQARSRRPFNRIGVAAMHSPILVARFMGKVDRRKGPRWETERAR